MASIQENVELLPYNTFKIAARAKFFTTVESVEEARELFQTPIFKNNPVLILGGGSNILFTGDFNGLVVKNELKGITVVEEDDRHVKVRALAGENWHQFVMYCVDRGYGGVENLSLIPGTVGAAPMQNIGAYGVEMKDVIYEVEAIDISSGALTSFSNAACKFGYRESIFKHEAKGKYFISSITLTLTKQDHRFNTSYGAISDVLKEQFGGVVSIKNISDAVIHIRQSKLPDPKVIGNAGSFFKNPSIPVEEFNTIKTQFASVPSFPGENGMIKVPAGWLIEQCGWKGKTLGNIGVHKLQALVLVNYGGGKGNDLWKLALNIQSTVFEKFGITIHPEVNVI